MIDNFEAMIADAAHWQNRPPPLAPNQEEVDLYRALVESKSPICLLGMTKELVELCDLAVDLNPIEIGKPTLKADWNELTGRFGAVIGDGVINLAGVELVDRMLAVADRFVARVFMEKQPGMKYARVFPTAFPEASSVTITQPNIAMVMWTKPCVR
jgi:hypothetical protein